MATTFSQAQRPLQLTTPLGTDKLFLIGLTGQDGLSRLFRFHLDLIALNATQVAIDDLLGQPIVAKLALADGERVFHGICSRIGHGERGADFTQYRAEIVPSFWLLTRRVRSRIFQEPESTVVDILKKVLVGLDVSYQVQGTFHRRNFVVQYRESDFAFASRLMEEEGIYYYFKHTAGGHQLVLANTPNGHADVPVASAIQYEPIQGGNRPDDRIYEWSKQQELRSGKVTLWDYCFEKTESHLDASSEIQATAAAGTKSHKLKVANNTQLELYDYPGSYANRFDGIDKGGGERPAEIEKIFEDNARTAGIRMQQEAVHSLIIDGLSTCGQLTAGHRFTLTQHTHANGAYILTAVTHNAQLRNYLTNQVGDLDYENRFTCIPATIPYRPARTTPLPVVHGAQTAVVVGPAGEEIYTDKYSRVKVQFHWDREGQKNAGSSCWVRVSTLWAGKQWGMIHIPRIGQEVIVDFLEGDPDKPIIVGSVYNEAHMPPYGLPDNRTQSGIKSRSSLGGSPENFNEIRFEDKKGEEQVYIHAEKNQDIAVENDETHWVGHDRAKTIDHDETVHVKHDRTETVDNNETITVHNNRVETVGVNETITIGSNRTETVGANETVTVGSNRSMTVGSNETLVVALTRTHTVGVNEAIVVGAAQEVVVGAARTITVGGGQTVTIAKGLSETIGKDHASKVGGGRMTTVGKDDSLTVGKKLAISAGDEISLTTGKASIVMKKDGTITITGKDITVKGSGKVNVKASKDVIVKGKKILEN